MSETSSIEFPLFRPSSSCTPTDGRSPFSTSTPYPFPTGSPSRARKSKPQPPPLQGLSTVRRREGLDDDERRQAARPTSIIRDRANDDATTGSGSTSSRSPLAVTLALACEPVLSYASSRDKAVPPSSSSVTSPTAIETDVTPSKTTRRLSLSSIPSCPSPSSSPSPSLSPLPDDPHPLATPTQRHYFVQLSDWFESQVPDKARNDGALATTLEPSKGTMGRRRDGRARRVELGRVTIQQKKGEEDDDDEDDNVEERTFRLSFRTTTTTTTTTKKGPPRPPCPSSGSCRPSSRPPKPAFSLSWNCLACSSAGVDVDVER
ncbi:hypothetical protein JCM10212_004739 [Sporobolomyces blumeae]